MKKVSHTKRYFAKDRAGIVLFHLDLITTLDPQNIKVVISATYDFSLTQIPRIITQIESQHYDDEKRLCLIALAIHLIKRLPGIKFEILTDDDDNFMEWSGECGYDNVLNDIIKNAEFKDYTPFSSSRNEFFFEKLRSFISEDKILYETVKKNHFEKLISKNLSLQLEYVQHYEHNSNFYCFEKENNGMKYRFFIMTWMKDIKLIFFREE